MTRLDLGTAILLAVNNHSGQKDWAKWPYVTHPLRLMTRMETEDTKILAVLHDVVEDCPGVSFHSLELAGLEPHLLEALQLLTRQDNHDPAGYDAYVDKLSTNPLARKVKIADLEDNMSLTRMPREIKESDVPRLATYYRSWVKLKKLEDPSFTTKVGSP